MVDNLNARIVRLKAKLGVAGFRQIADQLLPKDTAGKPCCPFCRSGTGPNGTSGFVIDGYAGGSGHCFACGGRGDVLDLVGSTQGIADVEGRIAWVEKWLEQQPQLSSIADPQQIIAQGPAPAKPDYSAGRAFHASLIAGAQEHIEDPEAVEYLAERGISLEVAKKHSYGYDRANKRIVMPIPGSSYYHIDRDITGTAHHKYDKPATKLVGPQPLWDASALDSSTVVVVEGPFDALPVEECGYSAIALCGTASAQLVEECARRRYSGTIIMLADADTAGRKAAKATAEELAGMGICVHVAELSGAKDAAELFATDRQELAAQLAAIAADAARTRAQFNAAKIRAAVGGADLDDVLAVFSDTSKLTDAIPTGLPTLDDQLDGGLQPGLIVLGAISSLGKTTLLEQWASWLARQGVCVIFVSLEQSVRELVAKSLSRNSFLAHEGRWSS